MIECRSVEHFNKLRDRYFPLMDRRDLQYLNNIEDHAQYPVKRSEQGAYMYHRQTSQGSEVMNAANKPMRAASALCPVNATMLTIKLNVVISKHRKKLMVTRERVYSTWGQGVLRGLR